MVSTSENHSSFFMFPFLKRHLKRFFSECLLQAGETIPKKDPTSGSEKMGSSKEILTTPAVHLLAFFVLFYFGVELTMSGNATSFHTRTMQVDDRLLFFLFFQNARLDRDVHH